METKFTRVGLALLLERENICRAGSSGSARAPVRLAWFAGAGSGARAGTAPPAIKMAFGGEFPEGEEGNSPHEDSRCGGNLRNGSNAGASYLNCRNRLGGENWNYVA